MDTTKWQLALTKINVEDEQGKTIKYEQVNAGDYHSLAIDEDNNLWIWGYNHYGQLGETEISYRIYPKKILEGIKFEKITAGENHSVCLDKEGNIWTWGGNNYGQLGRKQVEDENNSIISIPQKIMKDSDIKFKELATGSNHSIAIDLNGNIWSWGLNENGQLGDGSAINKLVPIQITKDIKFVKVSAGYYSSFAIDENGDIWSWGNNGYGQLGLGDFNERREPTQVVQTIKFTEISAGAYHCLAIDSEGKLWSWGYNGFGQLGNNNNSGKIPQKVFE